MALPNGAIVLTDGLVTLLADRPDAVIGVLAHELGHLQLRHSMRLLLEVSALTGLSAIVLGDASGIIAQAPLLLGVLSYSREHETEADDQAITMMRAAGLSPAELAVFFERARGFIAHQTRSKQEKDKAKIPDEKSDSISRFKFPDWLPTHPSDSARFDKLKRLPN